MQETPPLLLTGAPIIPHMRVNIELPQNATGIKLSVKTDQPSTRTLDTPPDFAKPPMIITGDEIANGTPDKTIYSTDQFYPTQNAELMAMHRKNGKIFAAIRIFPVQVNPVSRELRSVKSVTIQLDYSLSRSTEYGATRPFVSRKSLAADWQYLIITTNTLADSFQGLADDKEAAGLGVHIATVSEIYQNYQGEDCAAKIRAFIQDGFQNHGVEYVLLGGDATVIPVRFAYGFVLSVATIPTDIYYACLDGTWDGNGNGIYGESDDGDSGGDVDLMAEVHLGRALVATPQEVTNFIQKCRSYVARSEASHALFAAEYLGSYSTDDGGTIYAHGGNALDNFRRTFAAFDLSWLDDRPHNARTWTAANISAKLNESPNIVAHMGHGNTTSAMSMNATAVAKLTNATPFFINSLACNIGRFDYTTSSCFAKAMIASPHAAVAAVMNSREGWFSADDENAFSGEFAHKFFEKSIGYAMTLGEAHYAAKHDLLAALGANNPNSGVYRWCYFENTLFGDPHLRLRRPDPLAIEQKSFTNSIAMVSTDISAPFQFELINTMTNALRTEITTEAIFLEDTTENHNVAGLEDDAIAFDIDVTACLALPDGTYTGRVFFENLDTGTVLTNIVALRKLPPPQIIDSTGLPSDSILDFGQIDVGLAETETITIHNCSQTEPLVIESCKRDGRLLRNGAVCADFIGYDHTTGYLAYFNTDSPTLTYYYSPCVIDAICTIPGDKASTFILSAERAAMLKFDRATHTAHKVVSVAPPFANQIWTALAFNETDGNFFATATGTNSPFRTTFVIIATNGLPVTHLATIDKTLNSLAISRENIFYGIDISNGSLCTINPFSGATATLASTGLDTAYRQSLFFDRDGQTLFWTASTYDDRAFLRFIDTGSGQNFEIYEFTRTAVFPPELVAVALPGNPPFSFADVRLPLEISPGGTATFPVRYLPEESGTNHSTFTFYMQGMTSPLASIECEASAVKRSAIPAVWLQRYNLPTDGSADDIDSDGDSFCNIDEYIAGTAPDDPNSALKINTIWKIPNIAENRFTISWSSVPGHQYRLETAETPNAADFYTLMTLIATNTTTSVSVERVNSAAFFKITTERSQTP